MKPQLEGKSFLVTGAATGIGKAVARCFAAEGARLTVFGLGGERLEEVAAEIGATAVHGSVTEEPDIARALEAAGPLDGLANVAGVVAEDVPAGIDDAVWERTIAVNLTGTMRMCRAVLPGLIERGGGVIVNVASVAAFNASPGLATYAVSKAGVVAFTRSIANSYGPRNVRANCLCPGWTRTPLSEAEMDTAARAAGTDREAEFAKVAQRIGLRRVASPDEIASCALFLASGLSSFVNGVALVADGGGFAPAAARAV